MNDADSMADRDESPDEALVAYLDGELDDVQQQQVEEQLANDAAYRRQLRGLERAWDCLDALPSTTVEDKFTRSTLEMVTVAASREVEARRASLPGERRTHAILIAATLAASLVAGFVVAAAVWPDEDGALVRNLPLVENVDRYLDVPDVAFLRKLKETGLTVDDQTAEVESVSALDVARMDSAARRQWIEQLEPDQKARLDMQRERFTKLTPKETSHARELHQAILDDLDAEELMVVLARYHEWLKVLSPGERHELRKKDTEARIQAIGQIEERRARTEKHRSRAREEMERRRIKRLEPLTPADVDVVLSWLEESLLPKSDNFLQQLPERQQEHTKAMLARLSDPQHQTVALWQAWQRADRKAEQPTLPGALGEADFQKLEAALSAEPKEELQKASTTSEQIKVLRGFVPKAIHDRLVSRRFGRNLPPVTAEELVRFFDEELNSQQREELLALPREAMQRELRRKYFLGADAPAMGPRMGPPGRGYPRGRDWSRRDRGRRPGGPPRRSDRRNLSPPSDSPPSDRPPPDGPPPEGPPPHGSP